MDNLKHWLWLASAGLSGAFIGMSVHPKERTIWQRAVFIVSGVLVAFWLTPFICKYFGMTGPEEVSAIAFASGAFWSSIVNKVGEVIEVIRLPLTGRGKQ